MKSIIILVLVATAFATNLAAFEKLEKSKLGKTLLNTIAIQMQTGEPLERIFQTLYDLEDRYQNDQREDDAENKAFQGVCDADLAGLNQELANLEQRDTELQATLDQLQPVHDQKVGQRVAKLAEKALLQKVIDETTAKRQEENDDFEAQREEFTFVSGVLAEARRLFTDNLQAPAFLQKGASEAVHYTPQVFAQVASHLNAAAHKAGQMKHVRTFGKAIKLMAQLAVKSQQYANQELTGRIIQLIDDLQNQLQQAFDLARKTEDSRRQAFEAYNTLLNRDMNKLNSAIANLEAEIQSLADQLAATHSSQDDNTARHEAKTQQRDDRRAECQQAAYEYQQRRSARDGDRQTVSDLIGHLNTNMRDLKEYIAMRVAAGDSDLSQ
ncbi:unnamed protein product (macronuclear) [Paramecium tetraurelia]|uniref:Trichocyst matrix protein n=1 Tax=Paramecium tetraurelia TaxID=5888 RepID=A0CSI0_PARTE|nr:uncharacterized protein GSPATT00010019001 [Paramecium tetraurelia]CAK73747.1 unnamed protein product [Paramecium tetraurelia]|eukprot:XP_001441144.1 hypothetical protein (macronuclear) [Paramecium tetraurelia strain d4-2]